jgi:hypothetical protein
MGTVIKATIICRTKIPPIYLLFAGGFFEIAGTAGLSHAPNTHQIWHPQYVFQILARTGVGCINSILTLLVPFAVGERDLGKCLTSTSMFILQYC